MQQLVRVRTPFGHHAVRVAGPSHAPPVLFVHGLPTSGHLWRHVVTGLQQDHLCIAPDLLGLGASRPATPGPEALTMERQAEALLAVMDALGHEHFTLVAHDQGGAAAQQILLQAPERVSAVVFTNCVAFDNWPVPTVRRLQRFVRLPGADLVLRSGLMTWLQAATPLSAFRRGLAHPEHVQADTVRGYLAPLTADPDARRGFVDFLLAGSPAPSMAAVPALRAFEGPALVLWGEEDRYLPLVWGERLAALLPGSGPVVRIPDAGHFWQEERPAPFTAAIAGFLARASSHPVQEALA